MGQSSSTAVPLVPLGLGLGGLIPFWGLAIALLLGGAFGVSPHALDLALASYGALIIAFLGGIRWGLVVPRGGTSLQYAIGVMPQLAAWACLLAPEPWRLGLLAVVVGALGAFDQGLVRDGLAPPWFGRLRVILSAGAGLALILGAVAAR